MHCIVFPPPPLPAIPPFVRQYLLWWFMLPTCHTHFLALLSHHFKSVTCVYSVLFSLQRQCTGCCVAFPDPTCFLPSNAYGALGATVVGPSPNGLQFCHIWYIRHGGVTQVDHESVQLSRLEGVVVASPKSPKLPDISPHGCLLASVEGTTVCLEILLQSPPPPPGRPSLGDRLIPPPPMGDRSALQGEIARGEGRGMHRINSS